MIQFAFGYAVGSVIFGLCLGAAAQSVKARIPY
jgi:hypothetical protein